MLRIWLSTDTALWPYMGAGRGPAWRQVGDPSTSSSVLAVKVKEEEWCSPPVTRYTCSSVHSHLKLQIGTLVFKTFIDGDLDTKDPYIREITRRCFQQEEVVIITSI